MLSLFRWALILTVPALIHWLYKSPLPPQRNTRRTEFN